MYKENALRDSSLFMGRGGDFEGAFFGKSLMGVHIFGQMGGPLLWHNIF